jgi:hypothetical protein
LHLHQGSSTFTFNNSYLVGRSRGGRCGGSGVDNSWGRPLPVLGGEATTVGVGLTREAWIQRQGRTAGVGLKRSASIRASRRGSNVGGALQGWGSSGRPLSVPAGEAPTSGARCRGGAQRPASIRASRRGSNVGGALQGRGTGRQRCESGSVPPLTAAGTLGARFFNTYFSLHSCASRRGGEQMVGAVLLYNGICG